jgi:putative FmdB family regulatory protein
LVPAGRDQLSRRLADAVVGEYISFGGLETGQQISTGRAAAGGPTMPHYEFHCERCKKDVTLTLSIGERERADYKCPGCGGKKLEPLMGTFFSQTSRKA